MIHEEGLAHVHARHDAMAARTRAGIAALGLSLQCPDVARHSRTMTAVTVLNKEMASNAGSSTRNEEGTWNVKQLREAVKARGILTAAGLGPFEPSSFRIGHMGDIRMADVDRTLAALADALVEVRAGVSGAAAR
jgi:alanine-glyoxylate transaminase/serine-glyoxylate transaminase/serine-pyruvate transaminase